MRFEKYSNAHDSSTTLKKLLKVYEISNVKFFKLLWIFFYGNAHITGYSVIRKAANNKLENLFQTEKKT